MLGQNQRHDRTRLRELQPNRAYPSDDKTAWLVGSVEIALEHHKAIWLLIERRLTGSAFALVRPLIDTVVRALWINALATEQQIECHRAGSSSARNCSGPASQWGQTPIDGDQRFAAALHVRVRTARSRDHKVHRQNFDADGLQVHIGIGFCMW
jgi:hypothetical protein